MSRPDLWAWPDATPAWVARYPTLRAAVHLTAEDALRLALAAYYAAVRDMRPPDGQAWLGPDPDVDPWPWASPRDLHDGFLHHLGERLWAHAAATGHLDQVALADGEDPQNSPSSSGVGAEPLRGAAMDGGASAVGEFPPPSAVGPASVLSPDADITPPADAFFCASGVQKLPVGDRVATLLHNLGESA